MSTPDSHADILFLIRKLADAPEASYGGCCGGGEPGTPMFQCLYCYETGWSLEHASDCPVTKARKVLKQLEGEEL
jgi:hypothetical protein